MTARTLRWLLYSIGSVCLFYLLLRVTPTVWAKVLPPGHASVMVGGHKFISILCRLPREGEVLRIVVRPGTNGMDTNCAIRREN